MKHQEDGLKQSYEMTEAAHRKLELTSCEFPKSEVRDVARILPLQKKKKKKKNPNKL